MNANYGVNVKYSEDGEYQGQIRCIRQEYYISKEENGVQFEEVEKENFYKLEQWNGVEWILITKIPPKSLGDNTVYGGAIKSLILRPRV